MSNIDRIFKLRRQRLALETAANERRLREHLAADEARHAEHARRVAETTVLRAWVASFEPAGRPVRQLQDDPSRPHPHPADAGRRPLITNWPDDARKPFRVFRARQELGQV